MQYQIFTKVSKNSETITNENNKETPKEIPKERYIYLKKKDEKLLII